MVFPCFSHGFPMVFQWDLHGSTFRTPVLQSQVVPTVTPAAETTEVRPGGWVWVQKSWVFQKSGDFAIEHGRFLVVILGYTGDFPIKNGDVLPKRGMNCRELGISGDIWGWEFHGDPIPLFKAPPSFAMSPLVICYIAMV